MIPRYKSTRACLFKLATSFLSSNFLATRSRLSSPSEFHDNLFIYWLVIPGYEMCGRYIVDIEFHVCPFASSSIQEKRFIWFKTIKLFLKFLWYRKSADRVNRFHRIIEAGDISRTAIYKNCDRHWTLAQKCWDTLIHECSSTDLV